jgi:hypothetical protein
MLQILFRECSKKKLYFRPSWNFTTEDGSKNIPKIIQNFVIIEGTNALNIIQPSILKKSIPIARLEGCKVEVFQLESVTICTVEENDWNYYATVTELLEPWIKAAEKCTIVSLQSAYKYKSEELPESCLIRSINSDLSDVKALEVPNFITGVSAGVGSFRKILDLPFSCYIVYADLFDVITIRTILDLLKRLKVPVDNSIALKPLHLKSDMYM